MKLIYLSEESPLIFFQASEEEPTIVRYGPPAKMKIEGRDIELNLQTKVAFVIDLSRTVGCDRIIFPFSNPDEIKIAKGVLKNYRDQGYFMDYQFPRKVS